MTVAYLAPTGTEELVEALGAGPVTVIGGGTMIVPRITFRQVTPTTLLDLSRAHLDGSGLDGGVFSLGAMTTYRSLHRFSDGPGTALLLHLVASVVTGGPQIRNRGTVGGSACYANPGSDIPGTLAALQARFTLLSPAGERTVDVAEFFVGAFLTCLREDEVLVAISFPIESAPCGYHKFKLSQSSWPIVTAASILQPDNRFRVGIGGLAGVPLALQLDRPGAGVDREWERYVAAELAGPLAVAGGPWTDELADGRYRERIAPTIVARSVADCVARATERDRT